LARSFRLFDKKRGNRRTGSKRWGSVGELVVFASFLLFGCAVGAIILDTLVVPQWRANHEFVRVFCQVLEAGVGESQDDEVTVYRPEIKIEYEVDGRTYRTRTYDVGWAYSSGRDDKQAIVGSFQEAADAGEKRPCWYDPKEPKTAVVVCGYRWWNWLLFVVPLSLIAIGGGGLIYTAMHWGKSTEHRAVMAGRSARREPFAANGRPASPFPNVPEPAPAALGAGRTLPVRLPGDISTRWALLGWASACAAANTATIVLAVLVVGGHWAGHGSWWLTLLLIPLVALAALTISFLLRRLLTGSTTIEISAHPLHPGQTCQLFFSQSGHMRINCLEVLLVCEEEATYRQGTDTRTERNEVYGQRLLVEGPFRVRRGKPFQTTCPMTVPAGAMHSFKADHNEIGWKLVVKGDVAGWPGYRRTFPLVVRPERDKHGDENGNAARPAGSVESHGRAGQ